MLLSEAIEKFTRWLQANSEGVKTPIVYDNVLRHFAMFMQDGHVEHVIIDDIVRWFILHKSLKWNPNSLILKASALRKFFEFLRLQKLEVLNPELIKIPRKDRTAELETRILNEAEYNKIIQVLQQSSCNSKTRDLAIIGMLWDTGMRVGELCRLYKLNLDAERKSAIIKTEKARHNRPFRRVFWSEQTRGWLCQWLHCSPDSTPEGPVFVGMSRNCDNKAITTRSVQRMVYEIADAAQLEGVHCHTFRHTKAHRILINGGSAADVMNILGHANLGSSTRYTEMIGDELKERALRLM